MKITISEAIEMLSEISIMNESRLQIGESSTFKVLTDVKKQMNKPDDVYKFMQKNKSKIDSVSSKSTSKVKKLFDSCIDKMNYGLSKGKEFIKKHRAKTLFLICIIALGIFAYDAFKDKFDVISKWFNKKNGVDDVIDNSSDDDIIKRIANDDSVTRIPSVKDIQTTSSQRKYSDQMLKTGKKFNAGTSTNDYLKSFYGNDASNIEKDALKLRFKGRDVPAGARAFNTSIRTAEEPQSEYNPGVNDPFDNIRMNSGRPHASMTSTRNSIAITDNPRYGSISDQIDHEIGHPLNKSRIGGNKNSIGNPDSVRSTAAGYTQSNDNELGTALGSIRRHVFRNTDGKVDTANPADLKKVLKNPKAYNLNSDNLRYIKDLNNLQDYKGSDPVIIKRREQMKARLDDPEYLGQFVDIPSNSNKNKA